jgi:hypothetical protein
MTELSILQTLRPPKVLHKFVIELCNRIVPEAHPVRVPVVADPDGQFNECFPNVRKKIARDGGGIQHGWTIWERPGLFIDGEFHAVWVGSDGKFLDVSPKADGETEILFLPDPKEVFDENAPHRRDNVLVAEYDHPVVHDFLKQCELIRRYEASCTNPNNPREFVVDPAIYEPLLLQMAALEQQMISLPPARNALCRCGSGRKFKKCCGALHS